MPIIVKCKIQNKGLVINYKIITDFIYLKQYSYIEVGQVYIESAYNYYIVYKFSKLNLLIFVDFAANNKSF